MAQHPYKPLIVLFFPEKPRKNAGLRIFFLYSTQILYFLTACKA
jgi:hypothetical protein